MTPAIRRTIVAALTVGVAVGTVAYVLAPGSGPPPVAGGSGRAPSASPSFVAATVPPAPGPEISADVVVYGATPSGILAAVSAARLGASVVLITPDAQVGGVMTSGLSHPDLGRQALIGGVTLDVFQRIVKQESGRDPPATGWNYEPHVALSVFEGLLADAHVTVYLDTRLDRTRPLQLKGNRIVDLPMTNGASVRGTVYVDASYEGDLMAAAGVPFTIGRESRAAFGETLAGVRVNDGAPPTTLVPGLDASGRPLPGVLDAPIVPGAADGLVQSATFRLCVTRKPSNRLPFVAPAGYDPATYVLVGRRLANLRQETGTTPTLTSVVSLARIPDGKADLNNLGLYSTDLLDGGAGWASADDAGRQAIWDQHRAWVSGFLWYLQTDPDVPSTLRKEVAEWGLCADEFAATGGWPPQLYVREARRMVGDVVLTQRDVQRDVTKPDPIALGTYRIDAHYVRRILGSDGLVHGEGQMSAATEPYQIPYSAIVPPKGSIDNLLVSVTISASHVAWTSIRMEPTLMEIGEAAGVAAALAVHDGVGVRQVRPGAIRVVLDARGAILAVPAGGTAPQRRFISRGRLEPPAWFRSGLAGPRS